MTTYDFQNLSPESPEAYFARDSVWTAVTSSNVAAIAWMPQGTTGELRVRYRDGSEYLYEGVSRGLYQAFLSSASKGKFRHAHVRGYRYRRVS